MNTHQKFCYELYLELGQLFHTLNNEGDVPKAEGQVEAVMERLRCEFSEDRT